MPIMGRSNVLASRAVLWDLDGTLADSSEYHWRSWQTALEAEGVKITEANFLASFGQRNHEILTNWLGAAADPERIMRVGDAKEAYYRHLIATEGLTPLPGVIKWVRALHATCWSQAIASSAPRLNVELMHRTLDFAGLIDTLVGAEDVRMGKPNPEVFLVAAHRLGVSPNRCVVIEDAWAGIEAARRAGMHSVKVGGGAAHAADVVVQSLSDLPADAFDRLVGSEIERGTE